MLVACLLVSGVLRASLPAAEFTLEWQHSIEHTRWQESYAIVSGHIVVASARVEGMGAGMDPGADAKFDGSGWVWHPAIAPLPRIALTLSPYAADYTLCSGGTCRSLHAWTGVAPGDTTVVVVQPCESTGRG